LRRIFQGMPKEELALPMEIIILDRTDPSKLKKKKNGESFLNDVFRLLKTRQYNSKWLTSMKVTTSRVWNIGLLSPVTTTNV
jgi:hypothetical protein